MSCHAIEVIPGKDSEPHTVVLSSILTFSFLLIGNISYACHNNFVAMLSDFLSSNHVIALHPQVQYLGWF